MPLLAYADESGHSADPNCRHIGICTVITSPESWEGLAERWSLLLRDHEVEHFHMSEFAHSKGPFAGWTEDQRRDLLGALLDAIVNIEPSIFGAVLSLQAWRDLTPEDQSLFLDPWYPCLQECAYLAAAHGSTVGGML